MCNNMQRALPPTHNIADILLAKMENGEDISVGKALNEIWFAINPLGIPTDWGLPEGEYADYAYWTYNVWKISGSQIQIQEIEDVVREAYSFMGILRFRDTQEAVEEMEYLTKVLFYFLISLMDC
jgi:hypothetical protein